MKRLRKNDLAQKHIIELYIINHFKNRIYENKVFNREFENYTVESTAKGGEYEYHVSYVYNGKNLLRLSCNIYKGNAENQSYSGCMSFESGNKSMNFPADVEIAPHIPMFESILQEVNEGLAAL